MISTKVLGLPQSIGIDQRPDRNTGKALLGPLLQQQGIRTTVSLACPCHSAVHKLIPFRT